jgi:hypothetical protein
MISLKADRETALYDAVVYGLFQYSGVRGRRAMLVLTDGEDNASRLDFNRTVEYATQRRHDLHDRRRPADHQGGAALAGATAGKDDRRRGVLLASGAGLQKVYDQIDRELRSQYVLAYTSNAETVSTEFRRVTVNVKRPGVEVRTIAGYYPGE